MTGVSAGPVLRLKMLLPGGRQALNPWLPEGDRIFTPNGRSALLMALLALGVPRDGRVLLPAYLCDSVVAPVMAHGAAPLFYPVSSRLEPDVAAVESLLRRQGANLLVVIHYFGFPSPAWDDLRRLATEFGVPILEDCAHALYSQVDGQPLGSQGDAAIFSLRKSLPVPEGGVLVLRHTGRELPGPAGRWKWREMGGFVREAAYRLEQGFGFSLRARLLARDEVLVWTRHRNGGVAPTDDGGIGLISCQIAGRVDADEVVARRRHNFLRLRDALEEFKGWMNPLYAALPDGICPIGFPVLVEERDVVRRALARRGIGVRMFWDVLPSQMPAQDFPDSIYLRDRILVLPVHQDIEERHLERLVDTLRTL